jgi:hypothetical protein
MANLWLIQALIFFSIECKSCWNWAIVVCIYLATLFIENFSTIFTTQPHFFYKEIILTLMNLQSQNEQKFNNFSTKSIKLP